VGQSPPKRGHVHPQSELFFQAGLGVEVAPEQAEHLPVLRDALDNVPMNALVDIGDALPQPLAVAGLLLAEGRYLGVNRAWERFFGIPRSKFIGT